MSEQRTKRHRGVKYIIPISSTWRGLGLKILNELFRQWGITREAVDTTPDLCIRGGPLWTSPERGTEIQHWLSRHGDVTSFVILDDGDDMGTLRHRLVQTDYEQGLTIPDAERAIVILNAPPTDLFLDSIFARVEAQEQDR